MRGKGFGGRALVVRAPFGCWVVVHALAGCLPGMRSRAPGDHVTSRGASLDGYRERVYCQFCGGQL